MFASYIPDKSTCLCYTGVLSSLTEIPGCCSKSDAERHGGAGLIFICKVSVGENLRMTCLHGNRISVLIVLTSSVFDLLSECVYVFRISCKDLKNMLSQVNYRVPNMKFLREKLPVTFFLFCTDLPHFLLCVPTSLSLRFLVRASDHLIDQFLHHLVAHRTQS